MIKMNKFLIIYIYKGNKIIIIVNINSKNIIFYIIIYTNKIYID
jgi:hypothetical protein